MCSGLLCSALLCSGALQCNVSFRFKPHGYWRFPSLMKRLPPPLHCVSPHCYIAFHAPRMPYNASLAIRWASTMSDFGLFCTIRGAFQEM